MYTHTHSIIHVHTYSDSSSNTASIQYLNDNKSLPIYSRQNKLRTSSLQTVRAILDCPADLLCSSHPANISINCAFVVDTSKLRDSNDTKCDDCGVWKQTKTATNHLKLTFDEDGTVNFAHNTQSKSKKCYTLIRRHYTYKSSPDLSRHISTLINPHGKVEVYQFIQYRFSGSEHSVDVKPHGNSKKRAKPYKRTCPSTLRELEEEVKLHPPKRAAFKVEQKRGGIFDVTCEGDLPRDASQASRIKCKRVSCAPPSTTDPLQGLVVKFKEQNGQRNQFVQAIQLVPDPTVVLFNDTQINDIEQFCTQQGKTSVLGIDVTFNLGPFMSQYAHTKI